MTKNGQEEKKAKGYGGRALRVGVSKFLHKLVGKPLFHVLHCLTKK